MKEIDYREIYQKLNEVEVLKFDCGQLCNAACCKTEDGQLSGIYLLPGEDKIHDENDGWLSFYRDDPQEYDFPESWNEPVCFVKCQGPSLCKRKERPIQCRTFPLKPYLTKEGKLQMIVDDQQYPFCCPIVENWQNINTSFMKATFEAWQMLIEDERIYDLVYQDSRYYDEDGPVTVAYE